jgi:hypothetical protein
MNTPLEVTQKNLKGIGTRDCERWRNPIFAKYRYFGGYIARHYQYISTTQDYISANRWLVQIQPKMKLSDTSLYLDSPAEELWDYCKALAREMERTIHHAFRQGNKQLALATIQTLVKNKGIQIEWPIDPQPTNLIPILARLCHPSWWRGKFKSLQSQSLESLCRSMGLVSKHSGAGIYISDFNFTRYLFNARQNLKFLQAMEATNEDGDTFTLAELSDLSTSNPTIRRGELMMRSRGAEEYAVTQNHHGVLFTVTTPSKYHCTLSSGKQNPKYAELSPIDGQTQLNKVWARVRAAWARQGIAPYGFRVVEPQHDATPHWHLWLFMPEEHLEQATAIFRHYSLEEDGNEPGAQEHRFDAKPIDPSKGSATGYIAKYISKGIDGHGIDKDLYGKDANSSAQRIKAWASTWNIRQFQPIGMPSVTVWRELRRISAEDVDQSVLFEATKAADSGDWLAFVEVMGGMNCKREDRPIRPLHIKRPEENRYGEITKQLKGLICLSEAIITRLHCWTIKPVRANQSDKSEDAKLSAMASNLAAINAPDLRAPPSNPATLDLCQ